MANSENSFVRVVENENVGRSYFANENLPMGTKILSEIPFGCVLINETVLEGNAHGICCSCLKIFETGGRIWRGTNGVVYCSAECQERGGGQYHTIIYGKPLEDLMEKVGSKTFRLVMWFLLNATDPAEILHQLQSKPQFPETESFKKELEYLPELIDIITDNTYNKVNDATKSFMLKAAKIWYGRVYVNSFAIRWNAFGPPLALAMYERASMFNHSCTPSAMAYFQGNGLEVRLTEDVDKDSEITISFMQHLESQPRCKRQEALKKNFAFECLCERCRNKATYHDKRLEDRLKSQISVSESKHVNLIKHASKLWEQKPSKRTGPDVAWMFYKRCWEKYNIGYSYTDPDCIWMLAEYVEKAFHVNDWKIGMEVCEMGLEFCSQLMVENFTRNAVNAEIYFAFYKCVFCIETVPSSFYKLKQKELQKKIKRGILVEDLLQAIEGSSQFVAALTCIFQNDFSLLEGWFGDMVKIDNRYERCLHWLRFMHSTLRHSEV